MSSFGVSYRTSEIDSTAAATHPQAVSSLQDLPDLGPALGAGVAPQFTKVLANFTEMHLATNPIALFG